jgi:hypothetical protein
MKLEEVLKLLISIVSGVIIGNMLYSNVDQDIIMIQY